MAGRGLAAEDIDAPDEPVKAKGLLNRLSSHATGRRSGDQFCVYVCDRFIVPHLSGEQQGQVADGRMSLDALTRQRIRERYEFRFVTTPTARRRWRRSAKCNGARCPRASPSSALCSRAGGLLPNRPNHPHGCRTSSADGESELSKNVSILVAHEGRRGYTAITAAPASRTRHSDGRGSDEPVACATALAGKLTTTAAQRTQLS